MPVGVRRAVLAPVLANRAVRAIFGVLAHPAAAIALFIASLYFWEVPRFHDLALCNEALHYVMHASMLFAGLLFWWRVFDRRPAPQGARYGVRLLMLWLAILSSIVLGDYAALKSTVLYEAYDALGRLFDYAPLADEQIGGILIWIPSSMMCVVAAIIVIHLWGRHETHVDEKRAARPSPNSAASPSTMSASAMIERQRPKNRALAVRRLRGSAATAVSGREERRSNETGVSGNVGRGRCCACRSDGPGGGAVRAAARPSLGPESDDVIGGIGGAQDVRARGRSNAHIVT